MNRILAAAAVVALVAGAAPALAQYDYGTGYAGPSRGAPGGAAPGGRAAAPQPGGRGPATVPAPGGPRGGYAGGRGGYGGGRGDSDGRRFDGRRRFDDGYDRPRRRDYGPRDGFFDVGPRRF